MKTVYLEAPGKVVLQDKEVPVCASDEALIKVRAVGICGSDVASYRGTSPLVRYPLVIGHEIGGEVVQLPASYQGKLSTGDHVIVDPYLYCSTCYPCGIGRTNCCERLSVLGVHQNGGMAEYLAHPAHMLHKVPQDMPWELVPLVEPLTIALHGLHRAQLKRGETIAIYGAGAIGLLMTMAAHNYGAKPIVLDMVQERLALAEQVGAIRTVDVTREDAVEVVRAQTGGCMAQVVAEASGSNAAVRGALDLVSHAGRIVYTGWPKLPNQLPTDRITFKEVDIRGARNSAGEFPEAIDLIYRDIIPAKAILTRTVDFDELPAMLGELEQKPGAYLKVNGLL